MSKKGKKTAAPPVERMRYEILGIILLAFGVFVLISLYSSTGLIGQTLVNILELLTGEGGIYLVALLLLLLGLIYCYTRRRLDFNAKNIGIILLFLLAVTLIHFLLVNNGMSRTAMTSRLWQEGVKGKGGGVIGALISMASVYLVGWTGTTVLLITLALIDFILLTGISIRRLLSLCGRGVAKGGQAINDKVTNFIFIEEEEKTKQEPKVPAQPVFEEEKREQESLPLIIDCNTTPSTPEARKNDEATTGKETEPPQEITIPNSPEEYTPPPLNILKPALKLKNGRLNKEIIENVRILEETLENFGIKVSVSQVHRGPSITRYEVQPAPGVKVSKIVRLADDIALSLAAQSVRIEAPIPGKSALGIEVPNKEVTPVFIREILESPEFQGAASKLTVALGKDVAGNPVVTDLIKMPHLLIAGATGSGKSVCLNTLICSILYKAAPNEVKFLLIDPKMVELTSYNGIPHLLAPVVTEAKKASAALHWLVSEMESRYELFASLGVRDISRYNQMCSQDEQQYQPLPYIIVLIDELSDLMMVSPVEVEDSICRLAQMARAAGIHLVIATQRPSVDVITGIIKANIPSRIAFAVSSQTDSRTILDLSGAEKLLGRGDMLFFPVGLSKPLRIQGALVSEGEVEQVVAHIVQEGTPVYISDFPDSGNETGKQEEEVGDPLFNDAARLVMEMGHASTSLLQRRFRIGYSRAARIMDMLEEKGVVGPSEGAKPRGVLMTQEQFHRYFGSR